MKYLLILATACLLAGCASLNSTAFNAEKLAADTAVAGVHSFNTYLAQATNGASTNQLAQLYRDRDVVYEASRKLSAVLAVTEAARLAYATNQASPAAKTTLESALHSLASNQSNVTNVVENALAPFTPSPSK